MLNFILFLLLIVVHNDQHNLNHDYDSYCDHKIKASFSTTFNWPPFVGHLKGQLSQPDIALFMCQI